MEYIIRKASQANVEVVAKYLNNFLSLELEGISLRPNGMSKEEVKEKLPNSLDCDNKLCLIAEKNKRVVGCLTFARHKKTEYQHTGEFGMTVLPDYWGIGIGTAFIQELENWCQQHNFRKIELGVWSNNDKAIKLYKKHDYMVEGQRKRSILRGENLYDLVLMGKWLG
jgi:RimJ/RimL family protein N-acetyltransferase